MIDGHFYGARCLIPQQNVLVLGWVAVDCVNVWHIGVLARASLLNPMLTFQCCFDRDETGAGDARAGGADKGKVDQE